MGIIFGIALMSFFISAILIVPFIDFLYKMKLQRQNQKTQDAFNNRTPVFDKHNDWKVGTPIGGGLLIIVVVTFLTLWANVLFGIQVKGWELFVLLFSFIGFGALGFYDDLRKVFLVNKSHFFGLRLRQKFIIQWIIALIIGFVMYFQLGYNFVHLHWFGKIPLGPLYILLAAFAIVSFANALNITDGLDGLASGTFLISLLAFLVISHTLIDSFLALFIAILLGSVLAFLYFNIYPARIWLGDVGSLSLGAVLAVIGLLTGKTSAIAVIGGVFVLEVSSSLIQLLGKRFLHHKVLPVAPLHLYLLHKHWEEPKIVMRAWLVGILFALLGLFIAFSG